MDIIPVLLLVFRHLFGCEMIRSELVTLLLDAEYNDASLGIAEGRVCLPKAVRKASKCAFEFDFGVFAFVAEVADL